MKSQDDTRLSVLLVEDDEDDYVIIRDLLSEMERFELEWVTDYDAALEAIEREKHDVCLLDFRLGECSGLKLLREASERGYKVPIILLTGQGNREVDLEAMQSGAADYLVKGQIDAPLLERSLRYAFTRTLRALGESEKRFRSLMQNGSEIITIADAGGIIRYGSPSVGRLLGYRAEDLVGRNAFDYVHPDDHERVESIFVEMTKNSGASLPVEVRVRHVDGSWRYLEVIVNNLLDDPIVKGIVANSRDVTGHKWAEKEIEIRALQQGAIAELGLRALAETDLYVLMNEAGAMLARTLNVEYCKVLELLPDGDALLLRSGVGWKEGLVGRATVGAGLDSQAGYTLLSSEPVIVEDLPTEGRFRGPPLLHEHGVVSGMSVVVQGRDTPFGVLGVHTTAHRTFSKDDVNFLQTVANVLAAAVERRKAEEALIQVREAERSRIARDMHDQALQDIIYALTEIDVYCQLSEDGEQGAGLEEAANALRRSVDGLRAAIFDLPLAGGDKDGDFVEQLESLVSLNRRNSPEREIELSIEGNLPRSLGKRTEVELRRVLQEALSNVRRHSGASRVSVAVGASEDKLWAEVEDDGRGFGPETPAGMGTRGMRERARALGGILRIESEPAKGTKVRFEMPLRQDQEHPQQRQQEAIRILLVEDHVSLRQAIASVFEREPGFAVVGQAGSLAEARKMLDRVDVAIVDLALPDGYGGELIKELRGANPQAMALVLTAISDRGEIARAVESGAAGILHKSVSINEVVDAVRRLKAGESLLSLEEIVKLLRFATFQPEREYEARQAIARLTPREREVLQTLAEGLDTQEIAERLNISVVTERNHVASIFAKLGVHSRLQALVFAVRQGVVDVR